jgi:hypothetical protein
MYDWYVIARADSADTGADLVDPTAAAAGYLLGTPFVIVVHS